MTTSHQETASRSIMKTNISIQDLLPPKLSSITNYSHRKQQQQQSETTFCPYSRGTEIHVVIPEKLFNNLSSSSTMSWNINFNSTSCRLVGVSLPSSSSSTTTEDGNRQQPEQPLSSSIGTAIATDPSQTCFALEMVEEEKEEESQLDNTVQQEQRMATSSALVNDVETIRSVTNDDNSWWSVHLNVWRYGGLDGEGTLTTTLTNDHMFCPVTVSVVQALPYVIQPIWRSLHGELINQARSIENCTKQGQRSSPEFIAWSDLEYYNVEFPDDGERNKFITLSYQYTLVPHSTFILSLDYKPAFISFELFPGDANRGFEVPPVKASFQLLPVEHDNTTTTNELCIDYLQRLQQTRNEDNSERRIKATTKSSKVLFKIDLYSNAVLILAPLPDMSMPFNVLSFTCTLYAFIIGSLFNLLVKKANSSIQERMKPDEDKPQTKLQRIKARVREKVTSLKSKLFVRRANIVHDNTVASKTKEE